MASQEILTGVSTYLPLVKDGVLTATAIVGACCALTGLSTWRRQIKGNADFDVARRLLRAVFRWRNAVQDFRIANTFNATLRTSKNNPQPNQEPEHPMYARWRPVEDARVELDVELVEADALWDGQKLRALLQPALELLISPLHRLHFSLGTAIEGEAGLSSLGRDLPPRAPAAIRSVEGASC